MSVLHGNLPVKAERHPVDHLSVVDPLLQGSQVLAPPFVRLVNGLSSLPLSGNAAQAAPARLRLRRSAGRPQKHSITKVRRDG